MPWKCSTCNKQFKNRNQTHSCYTVSLDEHLNNKSKTVIDTFDKLLKEVNKFGKIDLNPVKTSIQFKAKATFLSVKIKKHSLDIEFQLTEEISTLPVYKTFKISTNRVLHFLKLEKPSELNNKVLGWLKKSYELMK